MGDFEEVEIQDENVYGWKEYWGERFWWTPEHPKTADLKPLRYTYDVKATKALDYLDNIQPAPFSNAPVEKGNVEGAIRQDGEKKPTRDFFALLKAHKDKNEDCKALWDDIYGVPDWVDWDQLERGQRVYFRYGGPAVIALLFLSLLGGMGSQRVVETLDRTGGFGADVVRRRLMETAQHTVKVMQDLNSIKPGGEGWEDSVRVRLLHGSVRRRILSMAKQRPEFFNVEKVGVPINDLDSIATIGSFSVIPIWMGLPRQGIYLRQQEIEDYLALWRYVAHIMGVPNDWMANTKSAKQMLESILVCEVKPSKKSADLANNIIAGLKGQAPAYATEGFMAATCYWLNGKELSKALDIPKPSLYHQSLIAAQCWMFMVMGYVTRSVWFLDEWNIKQTRALLLKSLVEDKSMGALGYRAKYSFKWLPDFDRITTIRGKGDDKNSGLKMAGAERSALVALLVTLASFSAIIYFGVVAVLGLYGMTPDSLFQGVMGATANNTVLQSLSSKGAPVFKILKTEL